MERIYITNGTRSSLTLRHSTIKITFKMFSHSYFAQTTFIPPQKKNARIVQINTVTVLLGSCPISKGIFPGKCVMKLFKELNYHSGVNN
jgi:hypothetical protein